VVEVTSPSTRRRDLTAKRDLYRDWEVPMIIVDRSRMPSMIVEGELPGWVGDLTI
jgi:Uma2 family endonuclease